MRRADRLFQIVQFLRGRRLTTAAILAERLEVSPRTVYRDIADLIGSGVPIEGEAGVGYIMRAGFDMPPLMFTEAEIVALVAGARMTRAWGGAEMALAAEEALVKIEAVLPDAAQTRARNVHIHALVPGGVDPDTREKIDRLEAACQTRTKLRLTYNDATGQGSTRLVRPLALLFWGKTWTLASWCELREDFRMFRLDRMTSIEDQGQFRPENDKNLAAFYACHSDPE